jgi:hypothetical protein
MKVDSDTTLEAKKSFEPGERAWYLRDLIRTRIPDSHVTVDPPTPPETEWIVKVQLAQVQTQLVRVNPSTGAFRMFSEEFFSNYTFEETKLVDHLISAFSARGPVTWSEPMVDDDDIIEIRVKRMQRELAKALDGIPIVTLAIEPPSPKEGAWRINVEMEGQALILYFSQPRGFHLRWLPEPSPKDDERPRRDDQIVAYVASVFRKHWEERKPTPEKRIEQFCFALRNALPFAAINVCSRPTEKHWAARVQLGGQSRVINFIPASGFRMNWKPEDGKDDLANDTFDEKYAVAQVIASINRQNGTAAPLNLTEISVDALEAELKAREPQKALIVIEGAIVNLRELVEEWMAHRTDKVLKPDQVEALKEALQHEVLSIRSRAKQIFEAIAGPLHLQDARLHEPPK